MTNPTAVQSALHCWMPEDHLTKLQAQQRITRLMLDGTDCIVDIVKEDTILYVVFRLTGVNPKGNRTNSFGILDDVLELFNAAKGVVSETIFEILIERNEAGEPNLDVVYTGEGFGGVLAVLQNTVTPAKYTCTFNQPPVGNKDVEGRILHLLSQKTVGDKTLQYDRFTFYYDGTVMAPVFSRVQHFGDHYCFDVVDGYLKNPSTFAQRLWQWFCVEPGRADYLALDHWICLGNRT